MILATSVVLISPHITRTLDFLSNILIINKENKNVLSSWLHSFFVVLQSYHHLSLRDKSAEMENTPGPVAILKMDSNSTKTSINEEALKRVFDVPSVRKKPIMILSVSGAFRKGKSFLLNFLIRFLRNKGYTKKEKEDWIGLEDINDGFSWRGGVKPDTQGMLLWSEPFIIESTGGNEVVVFLMDTQGLFDNEADKQQCAKIFAYSTLLSSVQIFNLSSRIQEDDLEYLQLFTDYAATARKDYGQKESPFQSLLFLVRDWTDETEYDFGTEGGQKYLESTLSSEKRNSELSSVRNEIKNSFNSIKCFLMPDPGKKIKGSRKNFTFKGQINVIDGEFLEYVDELARHLLSPENLIPKQIEGIQVTSRDLINYAIAWNEKIMSGGVPKPVSLLQSTTMALCLQAMEKCRKKYESDIDNVFSDFVLEGEIKSRHDAVVSDIVKSYREMLIFGDEAVKEEYSNQLRSMLETKLGFVRKMNDSKRQRKIQELKIESSKFYRCFEEKLFAGLKREEINQEMSRIEGEFEKRFSSYPEFNEHKILLSKRLLQAMERIFRKTDEEKKLARAKSEQDMATTGILQAKAEMEKKYKAELSRRLFPHSFESDDCPTSADKYASDAIDEFIATTTGYSAAQEYRENLKKTLEDVRDEVLYEKETNEMKLQGALDELCEEVVEKYIRLMTDAIKDRYILPTVLDIIHEDIGEYFLKRLGNCEKLKDFSGDWVDAMLTSRKKILQETLADIFKEFELSNAKNKNVFLMTTTTLKDFVDSLDNPWLLGLDLVLLFKKQVYEVTAF